MTFTDYYAENSCTAGRSSFITRQTPKRTGLTKVGIPGAPIGLQARDITIAQALKPLGYATGQFGKNHLGDRNEYLPTVHGFDEFFGNLYHLNAEEEPEDPDYPKDPAFKAQFGPRGVIRSKASDRDDPTVDPRFGKPMNGAEPLGSIAIRPAEVDYLYTRFNNSATGAQSNFRYQAGVVFNFGGK